MLEEDVELTIEIVVVLGLVELDEELASLDEVLELAPFVVDLVVLLLVLNTVVDGFVVVVVVVVVAVVPTWTLV